MSLCLSVEAFKIEKLPDGWINAKVWIKRKNGEVFYRYEILDLRSDLIQNANRYLHESQFLTAFKCFQIGLVLPFYSVGYMSFHILRAIVAPIKNQSINILVKQIRKILRAPFYLMSMQFAVIYGVFNPLSARAIYAYLNLQLHEKSREKSFDYKGEILDAYQLWRCLFDEEYELTTFFPGFCFLPLGKTNAPNIVKIEQG